MSRFGFVGPSYTAQSVNANCQRCVNMYVEQDESGSGKSPFQLYSTPGLTIFSVLPKGPVRAEINANQRFFAVGGDTLYEVFADGTNAAVGVVGDDGNPASLCNSATQLLCVSNGAAFVYSLSTNTWIGGVATGLGQVKMCAYSDGYFLCLISNSQKFQISSILDATTWDPTDVTQVSVFPDQVLSLIVDHREIILHGVTKSVVYGNTGAADFPFSPIPSSYIEQGIAAAWCRDRLDNSEFWLGADDRGRLIANRLQGYLPVRISNFAVENEWQSYSTVEDAISYAYQENGHTFWQVYFPSAGTAGKTWTFDVATGMWHERAYLNPVSGALEAHLSRCHTFVFGQHMVGDRSSGNVYVMRIVIGDDNGQPIERLRRAPHISIEQQWMFHNEMQVDAEVGLSPTSLPMNPQPLFVQITGTVLPASTFAGPEPNCYALVVAILNDGTRRISQLAGPFNSSLNPGTGDYAYLLVAPPNTINNVISWQVFFSYDLNAPANVLTYTAQQMIALNYTVRLGVVTPPA